MDVTATRLRLRVSPRARRSEVVGRYGDAWKVRVVAPPEGGRANEEALTLVAAALAVRPGDVTLVTGRSSRDKVIEVDGLAPDEVDRRLATRTTSGDDS
jgi:uncharacterized protein (TIGR00251 family)